jgi:hypothetical protein
MCCTIELKYFSKYAFGNYFISYVSVARGSVVVEALYYKPKDRGLDFRIGRWMFSFSLIAPWPWHGHTV